jgi:hypothetical protein
LTLTAFSSQIVIGRVVGIHIDPSVLTDGLLDVAKTRPIARCGYWKVRHIPPLLPFSSTDSLHLLQYAIITETFEMRIPGSAAVRAGLAGEVKAFQGDGEEQEEGKEVSEALGQK